jgi:CDP-glucose 4,6-dehydratase
MNNVLITGITGFLGSNLALKLNEELFESKIVGVSRSQLTDYNQEQLFGKEKKFVMHYGDIYNYEFIDSVINKYEIETIFHLASNAIVRSCDRNPLRCFESNIQGTWNIFESARQNGTVKSIVYASSDKYYGQTPELPYVEKMSPNPVGPYEVSKTCGDLIGSSYYLNYGVPIVRFRSANMFGSRDLNLSRIVPNSIRKLLNGEAPMIWSEVGNYTREFIHVDDVVDALILLAKNITATKGEAYNIGSLQIFKVKEFARLICQAAKIPIVPAVVDKEIEFKEIPEQYLDKSKIQDTLGWTAEKTNCDFGKCLTETIEWYKNYYRGLK